MHSTSYCVTGNRHGLPLHVAGINTYLFSGIIILLTEITSPFDEVYTEGIVKTNMKLEWGKSVDLYSLERRCSLWKLMADSRFLFAFWDFMFKPTGFFLHC